MSNISQHFTAVVNTYHGFPASTIPNDQAIRKYVADNPHFLPVRMQGFVSWILYNKRITPFGIKERYGYITITHRNLLCESFGDFQYIEFDEGMAYSKEVLLFKDAYTALELDAYAFTEPHRFYRGMVSAEWFNDLVRMIRKKSRLKAHKAVFERF